MMYVEFIFIYKKIIGLELLYYSMFVQNHLK